MCLICLEFNKKRDFVDVRKMIEAARREVNVISEEHLRKIEYRLQRMKDQGIEENLDPHAEESPE